MVKQVQLRRGTTAEHATFTGAVGEVTVDVDKDTLVVHDGVTAGGVPLAKAADAVSTSGGTINGNLTLTGYLAGPATFTIDPAAVGDNTGTVVIAGNLQVDGTTTTVNSTTMDVADLNITVASGAANAAAADGAGITIAGAAATITYNAGTDAIDVNKALTASSMTVSGDASAANISASGDMTVAGTTSLKDIREAVGQDTSTSGVVTLHCAAQGVFNFTTAQTANRTINFVADGSTSLDSYLSVGQAVTVALVMNQSATAYYLNAYQVDGVAVTPKWQGGSAPTGGNASSLDVYSFTIIKTASATFTVLASQTQYA